ncbi:hypothetical protein SynBOUM118_02119 [Synechococcus sp. BOUM118]|nr:hypothetical protein SynBOUM118_02119 [Synechococcus sp. BOUM118]
MFIFFVQPDKSCQRILDVSQTFYQFLGLYKDFVGWLYANIFLIIV